MTKKKLRWQPRIVLTDGVWTVIWLDTKITGLWTSKHCIPFMVATSLRARAANTFARELNIRREDNAPH